MISNSKQILVFLVFITSILNVSAQENLITISPKGKPSRTEYVTSLYDMVNISPFIYGASNKFVFAGGKKTIDYTPNEAPSIGIKFQHKWLGAAVTWGPKRIQDTEKGSSTYYSFVLNSYGKSNGFDVYYTTNTGYYVNNKKVIQDLGLSKPILLRPDLSTASIGFNAYYIFNHDKFSYRSSFIHNEIQKKRSGSFLLTLSGSYYTMNADSSVVLDIYHRDVSLESQITSGSFYTLGLLPGYAYTLVMMKRFYATLSFSFGPLYQIQQYSVQDSIKKSHTIDRNLWILRGLARASIGYNTKYFYAGISAVGDNYHIPLGAGNQLQYSQGNVQVFIGTRFAMPAIGRKVSGWMDKVPLLSEKSNP